MARGETRKNGPGTSIPGPPFRNDEERARHAQVSEFNSRNLLGMGGGKGAKANLGGPKHEAPFEPDHTSAKAVSEYLNNDPDAGTMKRMKEQFLDGHEKLMKMLFGAGQ